ncbi:MAG: hypothetical protein ACOC9P_00810 [bacterium]
MPLQLRSWRGVLACIIAGIVGTLAFDVFGLILGNPWWDIPTMLGEATGAGLFGGVLMHYANGIILVTIFAGLLPLFWGPVWFRAMQFITIQVIFGVWLFMMPLMDAGAFGLEMGIMMPIGALLRHWVFAAVAGLVYPPLLSRVEAQPVREERIGQTHEQRHRRAA